MTGVTIGVALMFIVLALSRRNGGAAVGIVIMSMLIWPEYLRVPVGPADMSVPRLVGLALLIKLMMKGHHRSIGYTALDKLIVIIWLWTVLATVIAGSGFSHVAQMIGRGFDTVLMYFIGRMTLTSEEDIKGLYTALAITAIIMCGVGVYEAVTARSPYQKLISHRGWSWINKDSQFRWGLLRAQASTSVSIFFGMAMMLILGMLWSIRGYLVARSRHLLVVMAAFLAALSSMSSGPWIACFMVMGLHVYAKRTSLIRPSLWLLLVIAVLLEVASDRHFYNLIDYFALDPQTAWYRTRLLEVAFSHWRDFWLVGVGEAWPHHWADSLDGRGHIDVVNHFLIVAMYGGLPATLMYVATHVIAIRQSVRAWQEDTSAQRRSLLFGLAATVVALDASSMSVGLYGPPLLLSHMILGFISSASTSWKAGTARPLEDDEPVIGEDAGSPDRMIDYGYRA